MSSFDPSPSLQPLRIVAGWTIQWNTLMEVDPSPETIHFFDGSSLLLMHNVHLSRSIELCWRPEMDPDGCFQLLVLNCHKELNAKTKKVQQVPDLDDPFVVFESQERLAVVSEIERLARTLPRFVDPRIMKQPGVVHKLFEELRLELLEQGLHPGLANAMLHADHAKVHHLLLDHQEVDQESVAHLADHGANKGVRTKAQQKLNSRKFRLV